MFRHGVGCLSFDCASRILPVQQFKSAIVMFDKCGKRFYPVTVIQVQQPVDLEHLRFVDMAANNAVTSASAGFGQHRRLKG